MVQKTFYDLWRTLCDSLLASFSCYGIIWDWHSGKVANILRGESFNRRLYSLYQVEWKWWAVHQDSIICLDSEWLILCCSIRNSQHRVDINEKSPEPVGRRAPGWLLYYSIENKRASDLWSQKNESLSSRVFEMRSKKSGKLVVSRTTAEGGTSYF